MSMMRVGVDAPVQCSQGYKNHFWSPSSRRETQVCTAQHAAQAMHIYWGNVSKDWVRTVKSLGLGFLHARS